MSRYPFGTPNSWFQIAYSDEIAPGEVGQALVKGKVSSGARGKSKGHFKLGLAEAYW